MIRYEIHQFCCLENNLGILIHDIDSEMTIAIDTPSAEEIDKVLKAKGWNLTHILTTHHHWDHIDGHLALKEAYGCEIVGAYIDRERIPGIDRFVVGDDIFQINGFEVRVIATPGHTLGHVAYWLPDIKTVFVGDTLFSMGCGRLFEGDADTMWSSLKKLRDLPRNTSVYCAHEYTLSNAHFALTVDPDNPLLKKRVAEVEKLRAEGKPTLPTSIGQERDTNPFLRVDDPGIRQQLKMPNCTPEKVFAEIRTLKDQA